MILKAQIVIVYFFGGIAKINYNWLVRKQPASIILEEKAVNSILGDIFTSDMMIYFVTYGGFIFDILIGFLLFIPKSRKIAVFSALFFNITNAWLFDDINIFPYMMMIALVLFLDPTKVARYINFKVYKKESEVKIEKGNQPIKKTILITITIYFILQSLLPIRHLIFPGNVEWTSHGQRFAWRMKIQHRKIDAIIFKVWDMNKKVIYPIDFRSYNMNKDQINTIAYDPKTAVMFAHFLKNHCLKNKGMDAVQVKSNIMISLNGRTTQNMFDTSVDLTTLKVTPFDLKKWVIPLK